MPVEMRGRHYTGAPAVPPPAAFPDPPRPLTAPATLEPVLPETLLDKAFRHFLHGLGKTLNREIEELLYQAFIAGYSAAAVQPIELPGTKTSRTIAAALRVFKDFILTNQPEEVKSGEWCTLQEIDNLIAEWEGKET